MAETNVISEDNFILTQDPATLTVNDAKRLLISDPLYEEAKDFYSGNQWRDGEGWIGPRIDDNDDDSVSVMSEIEACFVTSPAFEEVTDRKKDALLGRPGTWSVTLQRAMGPIEKPRQPKPVLPGGPQPQLPDPTQVEADQPSNEEQALIDEANQALVNWYDRKEVLMVLDKAELDLELGRRGLLRLMVPESKLVMTDDGSTIFPSGMDLDRCLDAIWPVHVPADQGVVLRDAITMEQVGIFVYEVTDILSGKPIELAEISFLDEEGNTIIMVTGQTKDMPPKNVDFGAGLFPLAGHLPIFEMQIPKPLATASVLKNQKLLNMSLTMMGMNSVLAGFLERVILGGQKPGEFIQDDSAPDGRRFEPAPYKTGPATTQWLSPKLLGVNPTTKEPIFGDLDIRWRDPIEVDTFVQTQEEAYVNILHATHQLHVMISGDAVASGESRKQARDDYEKSLKKDKAKLDKAGSWLMETALNWAAVLMGEPDKFKELRIVYDTKVDSGPIAAIDRTAIREEVEKNLRSRENAMVELRITDDPEAEEARIVEEASADDPIQQIQMRKQAAQLLMQQASNPNSGLNNQDPNNPNNPNPGGGSGGGSTGSGSNVRRGSGRSKPTVKKK